MGAITTQLMTFEEFQKLPDEVCRKSELRHGELVEMPPPVREHVWVQQHLVRLLAGRADNDAVVGMEIPFKPAREYEYYKADVAYVSAERWRNSGPKVLEGSPELVIEILSPSNTVAEMNDRRRLFLETGCLQFWAVDYKLRLIDVSTPDGITTTYSSGQSIPLPLSAGDTLAADEIFAGLS
jgi:Uma2 family endonuclease